MVFNQRLLRLVYVSAAHERLSRDDLIAIGHHARKKNADLKISGLLLHVEGEFFQVLEGPAPAVEDLFSLICEDPRNKWVTPLLRERAFFRVFKDWSMGCFDLPFEELPSDVFFKADWDEVRLRLNSSEKRSFYRFLERFYKANLSTGALEVFP
ncbi:MAG: BLUF domain-containing protein [Pseudomonadota bacterium]